MSDNGKGDPGLNWMIILLIFFLAAVGVGYMADFHLKIREAASASSGQTGLAATEAD